jgi:hypothetical protein
LDGNSESEAQLEETGCKLKEALKGKCGKCFPIFGFIW